MESRFLKVVSCISFTFASLAYGDDATQNQPFCKPLGSHHIDYAHFSDVASFQLNGIASS